MESFELREEIDHNGRRYFIQTSYLHDQKCIRTSFYKNGALFDSSTHRVVDDLVHDDIRGLTKEVHTGSKEKFLFLLRARDKIKTIKNPTPHLKLARAFYRRNLLNEAVQEAELAIERGQRDSAPYTIIGGSFFKMGEYEKAYRSVKKGIEINPEYPDLHNLMGLVQLKKG